VVIPYGLLPVVEIRNSVTVPPVVILPILFPVHSVNQRFPSGPIVIPSGLLLTVGIEYSVMLVPLQETAPPLEDDELEEDELLEEEDERVQEELFNNTETLVLPELAVARSFFPSPLKSLAVTE
jgi:hypothetical protein